MNDARLDAIVAAIHERFRSERFEVKYAYDIPFLNALSNGYIDEIGLIGYAELTAHEIGTQQFLADSAESFEEFVYHETNRAELSALCDITVMEF